ncbi:MAG: RDD family protein [Thiolinea sp.]
MNQTNSTAQEQPVGFLRRLGAMFYDALLFGASVLIAGGLIATTVSRLLGLDTIPPGSALANGLFMFNVFLWFLLFGWFWTHGGQTLGMRAWKIRVVTENGGPLDWQQAFFRFAAALFSLALFGVGFLIAIFDPEKLGWHDRFSRTRLVHSG